MIEDKQADAMSELPKTKAEALAVGAKRFLTGKPCKYGHVAPRLVSTRACCVCHKLATAQRRRADPEAARAAVAKWHQKNRDKTKAWRDANRERLLQYYVEYNKARRAR